MIKEYYVPENSFTGMELLKSFLIALTRTDYYAEYSKYI